MFQAVNGTWKPRVNDHCGGDTGRIDPWRTTFWFHRRFADVPHPGSARGVFT
jgi:subtilisin-like proprotein convertase family protein